MEYGGESRNPLTEDTIPNRILKNTAKNLTYQAVDGKNRVEGYVSGV